MQHRIPEALAPKRWVTGRSPIQFVKRRSITNGETKNWAQILWKKKVEQRNAGLFRRTADALSVKATEWIPRYIGGSRIRTGDSPPNRRYTLSLPSFLFHIGKPAAVRGFLLRLANAG
ncbi:hypothetical protein HAX54_023856, partial [Datura stramonium]|nr:hypothetical protein [Datura stramonium]